MGLKYYLRGLGVGIVVTALIMGIAASGNSRETLSDDEIKKRAKELGMVEESTVLADTFAQGEGLSQAEKESEESGILPSDKKGGEKLSQPSATPKASKEPAGEATPAPGSTDTETPEPEDGGTPLPTTAPTPEAATEKTPLPTTTPAPEAVTEKTSPPTLTPAPDAGAEKTPLPTPTPKPEETPSTVEPEPESATSAQEGEKVTIRIASGDSSLTVCKKLAELGLIESANEYDSYLCRNGYDKRIRAGSFEIPAGAGEEEIAGIILKLN